jgi:glutamate-1-semialdehyde aminotransferase/spore coat polysaccharide biosynthesis protein SpsF (cytidylyltransferase family)
VEKIVAIVQARMGASRLPGKVLLDIEGEPMLARVVARVRAAKAVNEVVVATSDQPADDAVADLCKSRDIAFARGSETDVLDRFFRAAEAYAATVVVRITGDCPLVDPAVIDKVIKAYRTQPVDYATNVLRYTYPDGLDVEVMSFDALRRAHADATDPVEREHVTPYIRTSGKFRVAGVEHDVDLSQKQYRWTVDDEADLAFVRAVYARLAGQRGPTFGLDDVLGLLEREPSLLESASKAARNEGYYLSIAKAPAIAPQERKLDQSKAWLARAAKVIPSCSQTFSKGPTQFPQGSAPAFLSRGKGSHVWDVDGNEYIDFINGLGPIILGYDVPEVSEAAIQTTRDGASFSMPHPLEVELAEVLCELIPCAEMVRYGKNGSDVTAGAVRVARAFTGRDKVACCGYHGWQDWFIGTTTRNAGVPKATQELTKTFGYNDLPSLERVFADNAGEIACVIMEPIGIVDPEPGFLEGVKALCEKNGALLVFDEVVTGFRVALGGAQAHYGVTPDMGCFGKAMGNGFPVAAVVGRRDVMKVFDDVFFSFTFGGDVVGLAASLATIKVMRERPVIEHLWAQGERLKDGYNVLAKHFGVDKYTQCIGLAPRTVCTFADAPGADGLLVRSIVQQEMLRRGVLFLVGHNICYAHSEEDIEHTLRAHRAALETLAKALDSKDARSFLEGEPVKAVFRKA